MPTLLRNLTLNAIEIEPTITAVIVFVGAIWALAQLQYINGCPIEASRFCRIVDQRTNQIAITIGVLFALVPEF